MPGMDRLTPQERRRRAILEGLSMNTSSSATASSSTASAPARSTPAPTLLRSTNSTMLPSSRLTSAPKPKAPLSALAPEDEQLPELPTLNIKKRTKPWEDDFS